MKGAFVKRNVQGDDIARVDEGLEIHEISSSFFFCARWVAKHYIHPQAPGQFLHFASHVSDPHYAKRFAFQVEVYFVGQGFENAPHPLAYGRRVASGSIGPGDALLCAPKGVNMVISYGGGGDEADARPLKQVRVAACSGAYYQGVGVKNVRTFEFRTFDIFDAGIWLKHAAKKRNLVVADYFHISTQCIFTPERSIPRNHVICRLAN